MKGFESRTGENEAVVITANNEWKEELQLRV